jgi:hypothetical protein
LFFHMHNIFHPGRLVSSRRLASSRYVWRGLSKGVAAWAKTYLHCQQSKIHRHARTQLLHIPVPQQCFSHLHDNLVVPLQCNYIFTVIDRTPKWMEAVLLFTISAADCPWALDFH